jgi:hypothetical protein
MDISLGLILIIAVIMTLMYEFFNLLAQQVTTGVWDLGNLVATGLYSVLVGLIAGYSGLLNLSMPFDQWMPVIIGIWGQYFVYLTMVHTVVDYLITKFFPSAPQGLSTRFLTPKGKMQFAMRKQQG